MDDWDFVDEVDVLIKLPSNFNEIRESKKWQERKEALEILCGLLDNNSRLSTKASYGEILGNLQTMLAKDVNINVTALAAKCIKGFATGLRIKFAPYAQSIVRVIIDKLKEKKAVLVDPLVECIDAVTSTISSIEVLQEEIVAGLGKPNPQIKQQVDNFLFRQLNTLTVDKAPKKLIKAALPLLVKHSGDADQDVREASLGAIGAIYRLIGDKNIRPMLGELVNDESKMKRIAEYAEKSACAHAEDQAKLSSRNETNASAAVHVSDETEANMCSQKPSTGVKEVDPWDFMDPVDVLSRLPSDFETNLESKKWTERRDALQSFYDLLIANPKLDSKISYGENVALLKRVIEKDANINVAALAAKCLKSLAEGLRKKFAPHATTVIPIILEKFKEKKPLLRDPLVECIDAVASSITLEAMNDDLLVALEKANPNIKIQTDLFLYREFKRLNSVTMPKKTLKAITPFLIKHTGDSDPEVRDASYAALGSAMRAIGEKACLPLLADIAEDKLKMSKIREFYNKACEEAGPEVVAQMIQSIHKADASGTSSVKKPEQQMKAAPQFRSQSKEPNGQDARQLSEEEGDEALKPSSGVSSVKKIEKKESPKKEEEEEPAKKSPEELLVINEDKQQRIKEERNLKILKWNFSAPTEEHVCQLQDSLGKYAKASLMGMMFHKDFKQHLKAIELLNKMGYTNPNILVSNSDLLLKWCTLRFFETNPAVLIKALELAKQILAFSRSVGEPMSTEEMNAFVPYLFLKSGEQKENMRIAVREIIEELSDICGPFKMCPLLIDALKTKNARQRAECLQVMETYITRVGLTQLKTLGVHKAIAACVSDRDVNVRNAAINGLVACYREEGDMMWRSVGKMADKERAMVEERIKRTGVAPGSTLSKGTATPARGVGGAKIVVPPSAVRRPNSRGPLSRRDESGSRTRDNSPERPALNGTFTQEDRGRSDRLNSTITMANTSRYVVDDDYVEQTGVHALPSTQMLADIDAYQPRFPSINRPPVSTPLRRSGSASSISSIDTMDQLEKVIQNISSGLVDVAKDALEQVQYLLSVEEQRSLLDERLNLLMRALSMQMNLIRSLHRLDTPKGQELLKLVLNFLTPLTSSADKTARMNINEDTVFEILWEMVHVLHSTLSDARCSSLPDSVTIGRSLNTLIIRVCVRSEPSVFFAACSRCLATGLLENPDGEPVQLFMKCMYKWDDTMKKTPTRFNLDLFMRAANHFFEQIQPLSLENPDSVYPESLRSVEMCTEKAIVIMGPGVVDAINRLARPHKHLLSYVNMCYKSYEDMHPGWAPLLPGTVPDESAPQNRSVTGTRSELQIMIDNVVRDLSSYQKHVSLLAHYMEKHPQNNMKYEDYLKTIPLGGMVRRLMEEHYGSTKKGRRLTPVTEQKAVSAAQNLFTLRARFDAMRPAERVAVGTAHSSSAPVLQARDINIESFSGEMPVPTALNESKAKLPAPKKRRTIDSATLGVLQSRLAGIGSDV